MNLKEIKQLLDLVVEKGISEFELERNGVRLRLKRQVNSAGEQELPGSFAPGRPLEMTAMSVQYGERVASLPAAGPAPLAPPAEEAEVAADLHFVKSLIVGTFYEAPSPGAPPFVQAGDTVEVGQVLCIIEAMKLMNEIESDVAGEVVKCYVSNAQPVEYGEILFAVRPRRKK